MFYNVFQDASTAPTSSDSNKQPSSQEDRSPSKHKSPASPAVSGRFCFPTAYCYHQHSAEDQEEERCPSQYNARAPGAHRKFAVSFVRQQLQHSNSNSQDSGSSGDVRDDGGRTSSVTSVPKPRASSIDAAICATTAAAGIPLLRDRLAATNPAVVGYR